MTPSPHAPAVARKTIKAVIVTTLLCEDNSIYLIDPGQLALFFSGDHIEVQAAETGVNMRREGTANWIRARQVR